MQTTKTWLVAVVAFIFGSAGVLRASSLVDGFNVVTFGNFTSQNSDLQGTLAVGGNLTLQNYALNQLAPVPNSAAGGYDTVVGANFSLTNGTVYGSVHAASASLANATICNGCSVTGSGAPLDFASIANSTRAKSNFLYQLTPTGSATMSSSTLLLNASGNSSLQVFSISAWQLSNNSAIDVTNLAAGSTVVINVGDTGSHAATTASGGFLINGSQVQNAGNIIFNFENTIEDISIANSWYASVLAPYADVTGRYGAFNGDLVAASYQGNNQFNLDPFSGSLPTPPSTVPEPGSIGMLLGAAAMGIGIWGRKRHKG